MSVKQGLSWSEAVQKISGGGVSRFSGKFENRELESKFHLYNIQQNVSIIQILSIVLSALSIFSEYQDESLTSIFKEYVGISNFDDPKRAWHPVIYGQINQQGYNPNSTQHQFVKQRGDKILKMFINIRMLAIFLPVAFNLLTFFSLFTKFGKKHSDKFLFFFWFGNIFSEIVRKLSFSFGVPYSVMPLSSIIYVWYAAFNGGFTFSSSLRVNTVYFLLHGVGIQLFLANVSENTALKLSTRMQLVVGHVTPLIVGLYALRTQEFIQRKIFVLNISGSSDKAIQKLRFFSNTFKDKSLEEKFNLFFNERYTQSVKRYSLILFSLIILNGWSLLDAPKFMYATLIAINYYYLTGVCVFFILFLRLSKNTSKNLQRLSSLIFILLMLGQVLQNLYLTSKIGIDLRNSYVVKRYIMRSTAIAGVVRIIQHGASSLAIRFQSYATITLISLICYFVSIYIGYHHFHPTGTSTSTIKMYSRQFVQTANEYFVSAVLAFLFGAIVVRMKERNTAAVFNLGR